MLYLALFSVVLPVDRLSVSLDPNVLRVVRAFCLGSGMAHVREMVSRVVNAHLFVLIVVASAFICIVVTANENGLQPMRST